MKIKPIYIASDHAGFTLKEYLKCFLLEHGYEVQDLGAKTCDPKDDYPAYAFALAKKVAASKGAKKGILLCGSGQGVCMVANRVKGVRAALAWDEKSAQLSRSDDDANVLCLAGRLTTPTMARRIVSHWLTTKFSGLARHKRRIKAIEKNPR